MLLPRVERPAPLLLQPDRTAVFAGRIAALDSGGVGAEIEQMRRVLYVENHEDVIGGGQISLLALMRHLDSVRYAAACVCPGEGSMADSVRQVGVPVHVMDFPPLTAQGLVSVMAAVWRLGQLTKREGIELIHANGSRCMFYVGLAGRLAGVPTVWHVRVTESDGWWDRVLAVLASRIIVISKAVRQRFTGNLPERLIHIIYNGEDVSRYRQVSGEEIRRETETEAGYLVGMVGRLSEEKDHETYIRAAAFVAEKFPQTKFLIVGEDFDRTKKRRRCLESLVGELELSERVVFTGERRDIPEVMAGLDILVHCAHSEGSGRVLIEAMAGGTPVVATAVGGIPEVVRHGQTGVLVRQADPAAVGRAVVELLGDPDRRRTMGNSGRELVASCFSLTRHAVQVQALYDELLGTSA